MSLSPESIADLRVKHLEMIQGIIDRMSSHGATLKNYCITLTTAVAGFAVTIDKPAAGLLGLIPVAIFALLDTQYLRVERRFRTLFDRVRTEDWDTLPTFEVNSTNAPAVPYGRVLGSWSIFVFYAPLALAVIAAVIITGCIRGRFA